MDRRTIKLSEKAENKLVTAFCQHLSETNKNQEQNNKETISFYRDQLSIVKSEIKGNNKARYLINLCNAVNTIAQILLVILVVLLIQAQRM